MNPNFRNPNLLTFDNWGFIHNCIPRLSELSALALKEDWYYGTRDPNNFPILKNYLYFTFKRLEEEKKILEARDYASFDTGLVDIKYDSIYAIFERTKAEGGRVPTHKWILNAFATASHRFHGRILLDNFHPLPQRAVYFQDANEKVFDTTQTHIQLSDDHIIIDNIDRFPFDFIKSNLSTNIQQSQDHQMRSNDEREKYFIYLQQALERETNLTSIKNMRNRLQDAIEIAIKRTIWNFKTAIPMYYPRYHKMSLLLPLSLVRDDIVDIALVVEKMKSGAYRGNSILPLQWAYRDARLITRPDSDWLIAKNISAFQD